MKVVIVGGGFAGVKAAVELGVDPGFEVTLVSDKNYFEYHAALYRCVAGRNPLEVVVGLGEIARPYPKLRVVKDRIVKIDAPNHQVIGESESRYSYDRLLIATGSVTQYFGIKGLKQFSFGIKSVNEALELKRHLHEELERGRGTQLNYVIVGGGPTGVEVAGEMVEYLAQLRRYHHTRRSFNIILVEAAPRILPSLPEGFAHKVHARLTQLGVKIYASTAVKAETADKLQLPEGDIKTHTVVWTAGAANNPLISANAELFRLSKGGKVVVDNKLQAAQHIYVLGDGAATTYSGMAQTALYDAGFVASALRSELSESSAPVYNPPPPVIAIPVGDRWAAVLWNNRQIYGRLGWWLRRLADLKLFREIFPRSVAWRTWRYGNQRVEACEICKSGSRS